MRMFLLQLNLAVLLASVFLFSGLALVTSQMAASSPDRGTFASVAPWDALIVKHLNSGELKEAERLLEEQLAGPDLEVRLPNGMSCGDVVIHRFLELADRQKTPADHYRVLRRARLAARIVEGKKSQQMAGIANELCTNLILEDRLDEAKVAGQVALADAQRSSGKNEAFAAQTNLSLIHHRFANYEAAAEYHRGAIESYAKAHPDDHGYLAQEWTVVGDFYSDAGRQSQALSAYEKAGKFLELARKDKINQSSFAKEDLQRKRLALIVRSADAHLLNDELALAAEGYALALTTGGKPKSVFDLWGVEERCMQVFCELGQGARVERLVAQSKPSAKNSVYTYPDGSRVDWDITLRRVTALILQKRSAACKALLEASFKVDGDGDALESTIAMKKLATLYICEKQFGQASRLYIRRIWKTSPTRETYFPEPGWGNMSLIMCLSGYSRLLEQTGELAEAKRIEGWRQELQKRGLMDWTNQRQVGTIPQLAGSYLDDHRYADAEKLLQKGLSLAKEKCSECRRNPIMFSFLVYRRLLLTTNRQSEIQGICAKYAMALAQAQGAYGR